VHNLDPLRITRPIQYRDMSADAESKDKVAETPVPQTSNEGTAAPQLGPDGEPVQTKSAGKLATWENLVVITTLLIRFPIACRST